MGVEIAVGVYVLLVFCDVIFRKRKIVGSYL